MTLKEAKKDMERFVSLKTSMRPAFVDVLLQAEEVRHGYWRMNGNRRCECSVCHAEGNLSSHDYYCRNCGAKMDEVKDENT